MIIVDFENYEDKRIERNAWRVAQHIALRIDDAPVLSDYIKAFVTEREEDTLFFNRTHLQEYIKASEGQELTYLVIIIWLRSILISVIIMRLESCTRNFSKIPAKLEEGSSAVHVQVDG